MQKQQPLLAAAAAVTFVQLLLLLLLFLLLHKSNSTHTTCVQFVELNRRETWPLPEANNTANSRAQQYCPLSCLLYLLVCCLLLCLNKVWSTESIIVCVCVWVQVKFFWALFSLSVCLSVCRLIMCQSRENSSFHLFESNKKFNKNTHKNLHPATTCEMFSPKSHHQLIWVQENSIFFFFFFKN